MSLDIKAAMDEISRLEKLQAQVELRNNQIKEQEAQLVSKLAALKVSPEDLDKKIAELEARIEERMTHIRSLDGSDPMAV